jgi:hypothetical protein
MLVCLSCITKFAFDEQTSRKYLFSFYSHSGCCACSCMSSSFLHRRKIITYRPNWGYPIIDIGKGSFAEPMSLIYLL